jgi:hypothetical protein
MPAPSRPEPASARPQAQDEGRFTWSGFLRGFLIGASSSAAVLMILYSIL